MAKYNFPGWTAIHWELVGKYLGTCWPDSSKMAPHGPNWELVRKNLELDGTEATKFFGLLLTCWLRRR